MGQKPSHFAIVKPLEEGADQYRRFDQATALYEVQLAAEALKHKLEKLNLGSVRAYKLNGVPTFHAGDNDFDTFEVLPLADATQVRKFMDSIAKTSGSTRDLSSYIDIVPTDRVIPVSVYDGDDEYVPLSAIFQELPPGEQNLTIGWARYAFGIATQSLGRDIPKAPRTIPVTSAYDGLPGTSGLLAGRKFDQAITEVSLPSSREASYLRAALAKATKRPQQCTDFVRVRDTLFLPAPA